MSAHARYGTFVLDDRDDVWNGNFDIICRHIDGHKFLTAEQRAQRGFPPPGPPTKTTDTIFCHRFRSDQDNSM
jgi:hypothetical protein